MSEWRPIETAPKDGSEFLAYSPMVRKYDVVKYETLGVLKDWFVPVQMDGTYGNDPSDFFGDNDDREQWVWQPLPEPPTP